MKTFRLIALLSLAGAIGSAQLTVTQTTLSAAVTSASCPAAGCTVTLTSATGVVAQGPNNQINTVLYVDRELMWVTNFISGTTYGVQRGKNQTRPWTHSSGATVYLGPPTNNFLANNGTSAETWGSCVATNEYSLPKIYVTTGDIFQCYNGANGGNWFLVGSGTGVTVGKSLSAFCTGTVGSAETEFLNDAACSGATANLAKNVVVTGGTLANLRVYSTAVAAGGSGKDVMTVFKNGSATTITCTIAASAATCSDSGHSVMTVPGDVISFQFVTATSDTAANMVASVGLY